MDILHLNGTFGRLDHSELTLSAGLNLLYAPNETGKSTWGAFIRTMLYGLSTRERGPLADKNRYAPWGGAPMQGRMDLSADGCGCTLLRETRRAASPMGEFSCTYAGTGTPVPGITGQNAGDVLLGVPREVFERSAFIGQNALAVDQNAELERRIAALITTGEEDTSYTESYERLKKQLNRRRHNKTGLIPALERETDHLHGTLAQLDALQEQARQSRTELDALEYRAGTLRQQVSQWQALALQEQRSAYCQAEQAAAAAQARAEALEDTCAGLPDDTALTLLEGQAAALPGELSALTEKRRAAEESAAAAAHARAALEQHPLYPAAEPELRQQAEAIKPSRDPGLFLPIFAGLLIPIAAVLAFSAAQNNDKVGCIFFSDRVEKFIPPKKGRSHILMIIRELIGFRPESAGTKLSEPVRFLTNVNKKRCTTFILSDFMDSTGDKSALDDALKIAGSKHDLVGIRVYDPRETELPDVGIVELKDAESGRKVWVDTSSRAVRDHYTASWQERSERIGATLKHNRIDTAVISTDGDYVAELIKLFKQR